MKHKFTFIEGEDAKLAFVWCCKNIGYMNAGRERDGWDTNYHIYPALDTVIFEIDNLWYAFEFENAFKGCFK